MAAAKLAIDEASAENGRKSCRVEVYQLDVSDEAQVREVVNMVATSFGRLDYVVNAAGITLKHPGGAAYANTQDWRRIMDVNLDG